MAVGAVAVRWRRCGRRAGAAGAAARKDTDCREPRVCERGACVEPRRGRGVAIVGRAARRRALAPTPVTGLAAVRDVRRRCARTPAAAPGPRRGARRRRCGRSRVGGVVAGSPTIGPDGTIYVASHDGELYAIAPDGTLQVEVRDRRPLVEHAGGRGGRHDLRRLRRRSPLRGRSRRHAEVEAARSATCDPKGFGPESSRCDVDGGPTIGPDGTIYVGGDGIHAVWPDGTLRWKLATPRARRVDAGARAPTARSTRAARTTRSTRSRPTAPRSGRCAPAATSMRRPAIGDDGTIYVGSDDDALYAITPDGEVRWKTLITGGDDPRRRRARRPTARSTSARYDGIALRDRADRHRSGGSLPPPTRSHGAPGDRDQRHRSSSVPQDEHLYAVDARRTSALARCRLGGDVDATPAIGRDGTHLRRRRRRSSTRISISR